MNLYRWSACLKIIKGEWIIWRIVWSILRLLKKIYFWIGKEKYRRMIKWSRASADRDWMRKLVFSIPTFRIIVGRDAWIGWSRLSVTMKLATVESTAKIESFKNMITHMSTPSRKEGRDGAWTPAKRYLEVHSSCSTSVKYSQLIQISAGQESSNTANPPAHILWKPLKDKSSTLPTKAT